MNEWMSASEAIDHGVANKIMHATMEPVVATVHVRDSEIEVWGLTFTLACARR